MHGTNFVRNHLIALYNEYFPKAHSKLSNISEFELLTLTVTATPDKHGNTLKGGVMSRSIFRFCMQLVELTFSFPKLCPFLKSGVWKTNYGAWKFKNRGPGEN